MWIQHPVFRQYEGSESGLIRHVENKKLRKMRKCKDGYLRFNLVHDGERLTIKAHTFIADIFCYRPDGADTVHHKDNDKTNNKRENLQWMTSGENVSRSFFDGFHSQCHPVNINGVSYYSKREAERRTGISRFKI